MYQKTNVANDLRVITHDMKERDSVSLGLWVGVGGRYETDNVKGAAHFLEHILFKGSEKYSCDEIKEKIEGVGGSLNAFTAEEQTCYFAKIPAKHTKQTFDILADMVFFPSIKKRDVEKEKGVIIEEIKMYHDLPQYYVLELLERMMWPGHPLGKNLAGSIESVSQISNKDLREFHSQNYCAKNIVIAACGKIEHQKFVNMAKKKLAKVPSGEKVSCVSAVNEQLKPQCHFARRDIEQMHVALGILSLEDAHPDQYILNLLHIILGGNMSSRLFNEVREKRGLAYSIGTGVKSLKDTGMFLIRAGVDNKKVVDAVDVILKELKKIRRQGVEQSEFMRAKDYYMGQVLIGLEDTMDHMLWIGESFVMRDRFRTINDVVKRVKKITIDDVQRIAKQIIDEKKYNLSVVGPISDSQEKNLRSIMGIK